MEAAIEPTAIANIANGNDAYRDLYEYGAIDSAFLWRLRSIAVNQPHFTLDELAQLERRLDTQLDALMTSLAHGWEICRAALELQQPGEVFTATVFAMRSRDISKVQLAVESGLAHPRTFEGLVSALGWLPSEVVKPWIERLLIGKDMKHKHLGVAAASVRREDPGQLLTDILQRGDCRQYAPLNARALRLVGELRRLDLMPALQLNMTSDDSASAFWAVWSSILIGQHTLAQHLRPYVLSPGPNQARAIQLAFRVLPVEHGREWISALAQNPLNQRAVIQATGVLGDPHAVNWLIGKMAEPKLARLAGEAFTFITGIDLEKHDLSKLPSAGDAAGPNDDPGDSFVGLDEDENLPWPDADRVAALWRNQGRYFLVGRRYFLGKPIAPDWLKSVLTDGTQRQRHAAALELALIDAQSPLINTQAKVIA